MLSNLALAASLLVYTTLAHHDDNNYWSDNWGNTQAEATQAEATQTYYTPPATTTAWEVTVSTSAVAVAQTVTTESVMTTCANTVTAPAMSIPTDISSICSMCAQFAGTGSGMSTGSYMGPGYSDMMVQVVQVGTMDGQLRYWPEKVVAPVGSIVQFQFNPKNHTVSESAFGTPCQPITNTNPQNLSATHPGVFSGFVPVSAVQSNMTLSQVAIYNVMINSTSPTWIYCSQGDHCMSGMSMVINEADEICGGMPTNKTLEAYKAMAACMSVDAAAGTTTYMTDSNGVCTSTAAPPAMSGGPPGAPSYGSSWPYVTSSTTTLTTSVSLVPTVTFTSAPGPPPAPPASSPPVTAAPASESAPSPSVFVPSSTAPTPLVSTFLGAGARPTQGSEAWKMVGMLAVGVGALL